MTEGHGVPIGVAMDRATSRDMKLVRAMIERIVAERPEPTAKRAQGMGLDKGYENEEMRATVREFGCATPMRSRGGKPGRSREAGKRARRWVVEHSHRWLNRFRRLLAPWEKKPEHY
ncbi:MAG: transposase, partial [Roseiflexus sp.]|nr:transposase [Roseiflexus sp.]